MKPLNRRSFTAVHCAAVCALASLPLWANAQITPLQPPPGGSATVLKIQPGVTKLRDIMALPDAQRVDIGKGEVRTASELKQQMALRRRKVQTRSDAPESVITPRMAITVPGSKLAAMKTLLDAQRVQAAASRAATTPLVTPAPAGTNIRPIAPVGPTVTSINGGAVFGTTFAPTGGYDLRGFSFGSTPGTVSLLGNFPAGQPQFRVDLWTPTQIFVTLDPNLSGVTDQQGISLVLNVPGNPPRVIPQVNFYAYREGVALPLNRGHATFAGPSDATPAFSNPSGGWARVRRHFSANDFLTDFGDLIPPLSDNFDTPLGGCNMNPSTDTFDLAGLRADFEVVGFEFETGRTDSGSKDADGDRGNRYFSPKYEARASADWKKLEVDYGVFKSYYDPWWPVPDSWWCESKYRFRIWVSGPRGVAPW